jgi:hypothetical protein
VVSQPDRAVINATYLNTNPQSPVSTVNRGRTITLYQQDQDSPDLTTLQGIASRIAFDAAQVYEVINLNTLIMPMHSHGDIIQVNYSTLGISASYQELGWSYQAKAGASMSHSLQRVLPV